jgi:hypothetical protein
MLPDYPLLKKKLDERFCKMIKEDIRRNPFLSGIREQEIHEGNSLTITSMDGFSSTTDYPKIMAKYEISFEETIAVGPEALFSRSKMVSQELIQKITAQVFALMEKVTERTGNIVDMQEQSVESNPILDSLEKIEIDFDKLGNPKMPTLVMSPNEYNKIKEKMKEWTNNPNMEKRRQEIIEKKKKQWLDRENSRKLVD